MLTDLAAAPSLSPPRPGEALARFAEARGFRSFEAGGALWTTFRGPFVASVPPERRVEPDPVALDAALRREGALGARFTRAHGAGLESGLFVCRVAGYCLKRVERRHHSQVKKGLAAFEIRAVDPDELLAKGFQANLDTMARQGRFEPEFGLPDRWRRFCDAVRASPAVRVWGAFRAGRLSAWMAGCVDGSWLHLLHKFSCTADLDDRVNPALDYWVLSDAATRPEVEAVENGFVSITAGAEGLHRYKQLMGFETEPLTVGIRIHPAIAPVVASRAVGSATEALARRWPSRGALELAAKLAAAAWRAR